jgi:hypothetical protein
MVVNAVGADADHLCSGLKEVVVKAFEAPGFDRASAGEIPWIEVNREPAAAESTAAPLRSVGFGLARSGQIKIGHSCARFQNNTPEGRSPRGYERQSCKEKAGLD